MKPKLITIVGIGLISGCSIAPRHPVPKELSRDAQVPGFANVRIALDPGSTNALQELAGFTGSLQVSNAAERQFHVLALSGGGENGAYGAGLLCGWTESGTRPKFDLVTGISTGSLIAPLAFLGTSFDPQLRRGYTEIEAKQVFRKRGLFGILKHRDAVADSRPLQKLIAETIGEKELAAIAQEHQKGRRLLVMTTDLDSQLPVIWDLGAIAASGKLDALKLFHEILLASASIPVAFPPVLFEVEAGGRRYDELHVDGGVTAQVFGGALLPVEASARTTVPIEFYLVRNGRMDAEYDPPRRKLSSLAGRSIDTLMKVQGGSDIWRAWMFAKASGSHFHYVSIPDEFRLKLKEPFDREYMKALFDVGYRQGREGIPWQQEPPALHNLDFSRAEMGSEH